MSSQETKGRGAASSWRPIVVLAVLSMVVCGLVFPIVVTLVSQAALPYQANGELVQSNGSNVGSVLIAQNFTSPMFFHERNGSASGVDPDITVSQALLQAVRVSGATGIPLPALESLIAVHEQHAFLNLGAPYVDVLELNLALISAYPSVYQGYA